MKIFSPPEQRTKPAAAKSEVAKKNKSKRGPSQKASVSEGEIREKLAAHVETTSSAKNQLIKKNNSEALGSGFMNPEARALIPAAAAVTEKTEGSSLAKSHLLLSDVKLNDPHDSNTQEKLKSVLRNGAFSFNPKEKETLEKILGG